MRSLFLTVLALGAVVLVGCGNPESSDGSYSESSAAKSSSSAAQGEPQVVPDVVAPPMSSATSGAVPEAAGATHSGSGPKAKPGDAPKEPVQKPVKNGEDKPKPDTDSTHKRGGTKGNKGDDGG
jgi:hypothetical protein